MKSGCIAHPTHERMIIVREWQLDFCNGNKCAAALLSFFEYWHNIRLEMQAKARQANETAEKHGELATQDTSLWQFHTIEQLEQGVLIFKNDAIRGAILLLVELGAISVGRNPNPRYSFDNTKHFLFHPNVVNGFLDVRLTESRKSSTENPRRPTENPRRPTENRRTIPETTYKITTETTKDVSNETSKSKTFSRLRAGSVKPKPKKIQPQNQPTQESETNPPSTELATIPSPLQKKALDFQKDFPAALVTFRTIWNEGKPPLSPELRDNREVAAKIKTHIRQLGEVEFFARVQNALRFVTNDSFSSVERPCPPITLLRHLDSYAERGRHLQSSGGNTANARVASDAQRTLNALRRSRGE